MALFGKKETQKNYLGVDIGGSSIKMVELTNNKGRAQLVTYGYLERSTKLTKESLLEKPGEMAEAIRRVVEKSKIKSKEATTALPANAVFSTILYLEGITDKDLTSIKKVQAAVESEAKKVLPLPIEEMVLDWKVINSADSKAIPETSSNNINGNVQVLLTAAAKNVVRRYIEIFQKAGLNLLSLETESFAMARALIGKDRSTVIIVDVGAANTDITLVDNALPILERTVDVGGYNITQTLANTMGLSIEQAEQFKRDLAGHTGKTPNQSLPPVIEQVLAPIINEIKYLMQFFHQQPGMAEKRIDRLILSGGTAKLFGIADYFTQIFNIRTFSGDPWARMIYPDDLRSVLENVGSRLTVAIGLAMREIDKTN